MCFYARFQAKCESVLGGFTAQILALRWAPYHANAPGHFVYTRSPPLDRTTWLRDTVSRSYLARNAESRYA